MIPFNLICNMTKKIEFDTLTRQAKYLVPFCCIHESLKFDMQHDHILKKWNFNLLTKSPKSGGGGGGLQAG